MSNPLNLTILIGSVREGRFGPVVAQWFAEHARAYDGFTVDVVDLADVTPEMALPATPLAMDPNPIRPDSMEPLSAALTRADAVAIVTPDINRSYPASIKAAIDWYATEWNAKAVGFVGYSGASGGLFAIEHLRQVLGELNAHTVRNVVSFPRYYELFDADGKLHNPEPAELAAVAMLDQLHWWATALHAARHELVGAAS